MVELEQICQDDLKRWRMHDTTVSIQFRGYEKQILTAAIKEKGGDVNNLRLELVRNIYITSGQNTILGI